MLHAELINSKKILLPHYALQMEYFQDDVFPDTKVTWEPALTATEWFSGNLKAGS